MRCRLSTTSRCARFLPTHALVSTSRDVAAPVRARQERWRVSVANPQHEASPNAQEEAIEGLLPEEDEEVPGTYMDAMNGNTKLGKAVRSAVAELETLNELEVGVLTEAEALLKKLGMKGSLFGTTQPVELLQLPPDED